MVEKSFFPGKSDTKKLEKAVNENDRFSKFFPLARMFQETGCG